MYKIVNEPAPDRRIIRSELPDPLADNIALAPTQNQKPVTSRAISLPLICLLSSGNCRGRHPRWLAPAVAQTAAVSGSSEKTVVFQAGKTPAFEKDDCSVCPF